MFNKLFFLLVCCFLLASCSMQQKISKRIPDELVYKTGNTETGKVLRCDSDKIILQKYDGSKSEVKWSTIDSIGGHSCFTTFASGGLGIYHTGYYSTFDHGNKNLTALGLQLKYGKMKFRHQASYVSFTLIPANPYSIAKFGAGYNYYLIDYTRPFNFYTGARAELNLVEKNKTPHINMRLGVGAEYLLLDFIRLYVETDWHKNLFNIYRKSGWSINMGIRISKEYRSYYQQLNRNKRLK